MAITTPVTTTVMPAVTPPVTPTATPPVTPPVTRPATPPVTPTATTSARLASGAPVGQATFDLLDQARHCLAEAASATSPPERFVAAHLAALRAAAAVLAARAKPRLVRGPRNVWALLARVAPELSEWAAFFAANAKKRAAAEAGLPRAVNARESDDLLREADLFLGVVAAYLGLTYQESFTRAAALHLR